MISDNVNSQLPTSNFQGIPNSELAKADSSSDRFAQLAELDVPWIVGSWSLGVDTDEHYAQTAPSGNRCRTRESGLIVML